MAAKRELKPRKWPRQERSRAGVDAILQAAAYILVKRGWSALTTNAIAERAGVNIASLYQYFPNKESIVAELERRHAEEIRAQMGQVYARHRTDSLEGRVRTLVEAAVAAHCVAPELHRVFAEDLPRRAGSRNDDALVARTTAELSAMHLARPELVAWIVATVSHAVVHEGVVGRKRDIESGALVEELVMLLVGYLKRASRNVQQ
ncbi:MAG TPA: TetR/AcrR family transcriptional regulator [Polyangiales bacterium]